MNYSKPAIFLAALLGAGFLAPVASLGQDETPAAPVTESSGDTTEPPVAAPPSPPSPEPVDDAILQLARADRVRHEQMIRALEDAAGSTVYSPELTEAYLGLAASLEILGLFEDAAVVYDKALQSIRISNGLNSLQQIPVLEELQKNSVSLQDWEKVDRFSNLAFHITRRNYPVGDGRRVRALDKLGQWKLRAAREELTVQYREYARDTVAMYASERELLEAMPEYENKGIHMAILHLGEARAKLTVAQQVLDMPLGDFRTSGQQSVTTQRCRTVRLGNGRVTQICETVEVPNIDYYLDPSIRKNQEISQNLLDIRRSITDAFDELQKDGDVGQRNTLLAEMQELTKAYNAFVTDNSL